MKLCLRGAIAFLFVIIAGCTSEATDQAMNTSIDLETRQALEDIANARIFFGHHSVGDNLIAGLGELAQEAGIEIRFVELESEQIPQEGPVFVHARPGSNRFPQQKIEDFFATLRGKDSEWSPDLAAMKLCYVDVSPDTDVQDLANYYENKVQENRAALGDTVLMHITTPLKERPSDLKSWIYRLIGRSVWGDESNKNRQALNEKIVGAFPTDPVFDLALAESTAPDGRRSSHGEESDVYYSLWSGYTDDGGHLNEVGQLVIAKAFAHSLATALRTRRMTE